MLRKYQPRLLGPLGLVAVFAVFAVSAVGAATASAAIEALWCMESATGKYETLAKCGALDETGAGALKWEYEAGPLNSTEEENLDLVFTSPKGLLLTSPGGLHIECASDEGLARVLLVGGKLLFDIQVLTFLSCLELSLNSSCNSTEPAGGAGEIKTKELDGEFVYLGAGGKLPVGLLLEPTTAPFTAISCVGGIIKEKVEGSIIGEVMSPVNTDGTSGLLLFEENGAGEQQWTKVEETAAKFELSAFGEKAVEVSEETMVLLSTEGGEAVGFEIMA